MSEFGRRDPRHRDNLTMSPRSVERVLVGSAAEKACPAPVLSYARQGRSPEFDAPWEGTTKLNGHYGDGIVDALAAVTSRGR